MTATLDDELADLRRANAELQRRLDESEARQAAATRDLEESLEYQTATREVLRVISQSTFDLTPVLETVIETALRLCRAHMGSIFRLAADGSYRWAVGRGLEPAYEEIERNTPIRPGPDTLVGRVAAEGRTVQIADAQHDPRYAPKDEARIASAATMLGVPLLREGRPIGVVAMARDRVAPFSDKEIALVSTFADQAVIAIENVRLLTELRESFEQQQAIAEILQVINASPGELRPVFGAILEKAHALCGATRGTLFLFDGRMFHAAAMLGYGETSAQRPPPAVAVSEDPRLAALRDGEPLIHIHDLAQLDDPIARAVAARGGVRTNLLLPLRKDGALLGVISCNRPVVQPFSEKEIALLENFAAQAVIAMENARLLRELRERTHDLEESLEFQTATTEILQVINSSPGNLQPVFDAILTRAHKVCGTASGSLVTFDGEHFRAVADHGYPDDFPERTARREFRALPGSSQQKLLEGARLVHIPDLLAVIAEGGDNWIRRAIVERAACRTVLMVPLRRDDRLLGYISALRRDVQPFSEKEIALLENFATQAVIAMDNARLLDEIRQRQAELRVTFDNMGDGVAMFDAGLRLAAWNRNFQEMLDLPDRLLVARPTLAEYFEHLVARGEYASTDLEAELGGHLDDTELRFERSRPDGRVVEVRRNPVPGGGFVLIYGDITERKRAEAEIHAARDMAERALGELRATQQQLVVQQKMAALGQLTAGIAHEIKNPLNFVNNFAGLSVELLDELKAEAAPGFAALDTETRATVDETIALLTGNLEKIAEHGRRADNIVRSMLEHSRGGSGDRRRVQLDELVDEALNLAYHGARAQDQGFNITLERDFAAATQEIELAPQEMTRVLLNLFGNGFYAAHKRAVETGDASFRPVLSVQTRDLGDAVVVRIRDNGTGIAPDIRDKLFQPFFTTKPTGEGTGLGLSISWDIVTQQHGGTIMVESEPGSHTEFTIRLPRR